VQIREFATRQGIEIRHEFVDQVTGSSTRRKGLDALLTEARKGSYDVLIVSAIDRVGRSAKHLLDVIDQLKESGVALISLRESIDLSTPVGKMILTVLSAVAELERDAISERIRVALKSKQIIAKQTNNGWRCGRPTQLTPALEAEIKSLRAQGMSLRGIEKRIEYKVSRGTIQRLLAEAKKAGPNPVQSALTNSAKEQPSGAPDSEGSDVS
jgi:DNA invertase Pin-like site-specific DNA recombinase